MIVTAELSLYPLVGEYEEPIISFINALKAEKEIEVITHAMSTYVKGESGPVFNSIERALKAVDNMKLTSSLVIKIINKSLPVDKGFLKF